MTSFKFKTANPLNSRPGLAEQIMQRILRPWTCSWISNNHNIN